jgi:hypothetical protein
MGGRMRRGAAATVAAAMAVTLAGPASAQSPQDLADLAGAVSPSGQSLPGDLQRGVTGPAEPVFEALAGEGCDDLDDKRCLLPFPNDRFTTPDESTPTGLRVDFDVAAMPRNIAGLPIRPDEWNRNDGFSPGAMALTYVADLDLEASFGLDPEDFDDTGVAQIRVPELSLAADAPIVLLNADTGERHPYFAELDTHPDTPDDQRLLIIRPLSNLEHGNRYVVGLRDLVDHDGESIAASEAFATVRDELPASACDPDTVDDPDERPGNRPDHAGGPEDRSGNRPDHAGGPGNGADCEEDLDGQAGRYQRIFADLEHAGVDRDGLTLAWDFTVASADNVTGRARHMRDIAFEQLGDTDLADGRPDGDAPTYEITEIEQRPDDVAIRGTIEVPSFLTLPQDLPRVPPDEVEEHVGTGVQQHLPGSRLYYGTPTPAPMDLPEINPVAPTMEAEFACFLPNQAAAGDPARPTLYGHGLLGGLGEVGGGSTGLLRGDNHMICGTPWIGMATEDVANVGTILADMSNFSSLADRAQQGFVNFMFLGRLMIHEEGFAADPAFQDEDGAARIDTSQLVYDGNSQGGIMGGALTALAPDFSRAVLGVPGGNYSTLLNRSVDWEGAYGEIAYAFYPDKADQQLKFALIQMLWDRAETNGYTHFMTDRALPNTPEHQVILQVAWADHQVANVAAEVDARTSGARLLQTSLAPDRHWADVSGQRDFGLETFDVDEEGRPLPHDGSAIVYVDSGNAMPPHGNVPPRDGSDPHGDPRSDAHAHEQRVRFFETGLIHDTRGGAPYWSAQCRGPHNPEACDDPQPW